MPIRRYKPTSPGRRFMSVSTFEEITKTTPEKSLLEPVTKKGGRNNNGRITTRHQGGGHKRRYRIIDFKRLKDGVPAKVAAIEYDPNRSANIALLHYLDGEKAYILAPAQLRGSEDVGLLAVEVVQQRDVRRPVRVVLDRSDLRRHAVLQALEVDDPVAALVAAALVSRRDAAVVVAAALLRDRLEQALLRRRLRDLLERGDRHEAAARACRLVAADRHQWLPLVRFVRWIGENQAAQGRREPRWWFSIGATEDAAMRRFAAAASVRGVREVTTTA